MQRELRSSSVKSSSLNHALPCEPGAYAPGWCDSTTRNKLPREWAKASGPNLLNR